MKNESLYQGMVINPFGENVILNRRLMGDLRKGKHTAKKGESVIVGVPKDYPTDMIDELKRYFLSEERINRAYLLWMVRENEGGYLLVIDSAMPPKQLFPTIGDICQPFLKEKVMDMVPAESEIGQKATAETEPFYCR